MLLKMVARTPSRKAMGELWVASLRCDCQSSSATEIECLFLFACSHVVVFVDVPTTPGGSDAVGSPLASLLGVAL